MKHFLAAIPATCKKIAVLDRTKESGSLGEPLYLDVCSALLEAGTHRHQGRGRPLRPGLQGIQPHHGQGRLRQPGRANRRTTSPWASWTTSPALPCKLGPTIDASPEGTVSCMFYGLGSDGTVGANKNSIKIIGDHTDKYVQAYFAYDSKKSGGITVSHLRFGDTPIRSTYLIDSADFIACHNPSLRHQVRHGVRR